MFRNAHISECGQYRYWLSRWWDTSKPALLFIMLNPSTADAFIDDPTIKRCISFAQREGYGGIYVVNVYAFRATKPAVLYKAEDPYGPENTAVVDKAIQLSETVCVAWGANKVEGPIIELLRGLSIYQGLPLVCLGTTKSGSPRHPLMLKKDQPFEPFTFEEAA